MFNFKVDDRLRLFGKLLPHLPLILNFQLAQEILNQCFHSFLVVFAVNIINSSINDQNRNILQSLQPLLMSFVYLLQILKRNAFFSLSASLFYPVQADLWSAAKVDNGFQGAILSHFGTKLAINCIFSLIQITLTIHDLSKNLSVSQRRSFRKVHLLRLLSNSFLPKKVSGVQSVELESKCPTFGIFIIILEQVASNHVFPFLHGLFYDCQVEQ